MTNDLRWYVAKTDPGAESRAADKLAGIKFTSVVLMETRWKRSRSKARERITTPLMPGYVFVGVGQDQSLYHASLIDVIRGFIVREDRQAAEIPYRQINALMDRQMKGEFDHTPAKRSAFAKGRDATITAGPFKGHVGEMVSADDDGRVLLMLKGMFGGRMTVDDDHLEPVTKAA